MTHFNTTGKVKSLSNKVSFKSNLYRLLTTAIPTLVKNLPMQLEFKKLM